MSARPRPPTSGEVYDYIREHLPGGADPITYGDVFKVVAPLLAALTRAEALAEYAWHKSDCRVKFQVSPAKCTCGYEGADAAWRARDEAGKT